MNLLRRLKPFDRKSGNLNVIIETPKGCRNKYAFDFDFKNYRLKSVLPNGAVFPFDFGSIPGTTADDGDPLDVLLLMDEPAFTECRVRARLLGVIEAAQTSDGKTERNDESRALDQTRAQGIMRCWQQKRTLPPQDCFPRTALNINPFHLRPKNDRSLSNDHVCRLHSTENLTISLRARDPIGRLILVSHAAKLR